MVVRRKVVHLLKILLAGMISFQKCPPAFSLERYKAKAEEKENNDTMINEIFAAYKTAKKEKTKKCRHTKQHI